ncbi:hypothetical protein DMN64_05245 [Campylobacter upsaliensis]|nr:hypothetical protein [Campylobacter upsaliensis]EAL4152445.1 hypothetical protein [Campylobacter upsaliensis]
MSKAKKLHKKARLNLTPFVWRRRKVKQGQAGSSVWRRQTRLKRHDKFTPSGKANSRQKAKPNLAKPKKLFLKAKS